MATIKPFQLAVKPNMLGLISEVSETPVPERLQPLLNQLEIKRPVSLFFVTEEQIKTAMMEVESVKGTMACLSLFSASLGVNLGEYAYDDSAKEFYKEIQNNLAD